MMDDNIEIEVSFYCDYNISKGHYHDFTNSYESNRINLEYRDFRINEMNLEEINWNRMERNSFIDWSSKKLSEEKVALPP
jgi:hypothetical protein